MLILAVEGQFKKDVKQAQKRGKKLSKLWAIVEALQRGEVLPSRHRPHALRGAWSPAWECHIEPDWLLIYLVTKDELRLVRLGTHAHLFD